MKKLSVLFAGAAVALSLGLAGCGGASPEAQITKDVEASFDELAQNKSDIADEIEDNAKDQLDLLGVDAAEFTDSLMEGMDAKVTSVEVNDAKDGATAHVVVSGKNMADLATDYQAKYEEKLAGLDPETTSVDDILKMSGDLLMECLDEQKPQEHSVDLTYKKDKDGEWEVDEAQAKSVLAGVLLGTAKDAGDTASK